MVRWLAVAALLLTLVKAVMAGTPLEEQNRSLFRQLQEVHGLSDAQMAEIGAIFAGSGVLGQGNPAIVEHPMTPAQCRAKVRESGALHVDDRFEQICGRPYMAPLYDPSNERPEDAGVCIDQLEFPNIPCAYPVVWVRAREAASICAAIGKRLCDAHEWEGACAGRLLAPDYRFDLAEGANPNAAIERSRKIHNQLQAPTRTWSYGPSYQEGVCAAASRKSPGCEGGGWSQCGSNTYPTGAFPDCRSPLGVYDLNGNAAEHMNLPLTPTQMASQSSEELGYTEMKGSWFIFDNFRAHDDWCRWRAPFWHGSRVMDTASHANYHLGFRCCKTLEK